MSKKTMKAFSELDWPEAVEVANKTANHLKEIAEYMQNDVKDYDEKRVDKYMLLFINDLEELDDLGDEINEVFEKDDLEHAESVIYISEPET